MRHCRMVLSLLILTGIIVGSGCRGGKTVHRGSIKGTVRWNGEPLEEGTIVFVMASSDIRQSESRISAPIKSGSYLLDEGAGPPVGSNKVEIRAFRKTGETREVAVRPPEGSVQTEVTLKTVDATEQYLPKKFNDASTLTADVKPGENQLDFSLAGE